MLQPPISPPRGQVLRGRCQCPPLPQPGPGLAAAPRQSPPIHSHSQS